MKNNIKKHINIYKKNYTYKYILVCLIIFIIGCGIMFLYSNIIYKESMQNQSLLIPKRCIGFFACCMDILRIITTHYNKNKSIPSSIDTSQQFSIYKPSHTNGGDIMNHFFIKENSNNDININGNSNSNTSIKYINNIQSKFDHYFQFRKYNEIDYLEIKPFIDTYFSPAQEIIDIENRIIAKYNININEYCAVYYRGTDKKSETKIGQFDNYINKMNELLTADNNIKFIVQSDSKEFIDTITSKFNNSISFDENVSSSSDKGIHNEKTPDENYIIMKNFLAIVYLISKCKYIICSSGNCSIWMMLFRGNAINVKQFLNDQWY